MFKKVVIAALLLSVQAFADTKTSCTDSMTADDVIAIDYDIDGNITEYKRNQDDANKVIEVLKKKIAEDPAITKSKHWSNKMLTTKYWLTERCGGTKNCSSKECPSGSCVYGNVGMAGCRCE